jgi:Uma2 family endonuclease
MSDAAHDRLTVEQFYQWLGAVDGRWELVDGQPVIMAGATNRHDRLVGNALIYVGTHLRGHPCQPFTADIYYLSPEVLTGSKGAVWPLDGSPPSCVDEPVQWKDGFAPT